MCICMHLLANTNKVDANSLYNPYTKDIARGISTKLFHPSLNVPHANDDAPIVLLF